MIIIIDDDYYRCIIIDDIDYRWSLANIWLGAHVIQPFDGMDYVSEYALNMDWEFS